MSIKPMVQTMMSIGTRADRDVIKQETQKKVNFFQMKNRGLPVWERESALKVLIEQITSGKEDMDILRGVLSSGQWLLELEGLTKQIRWLKTMQGLVNFKELR